MKQNDKKKEIIEYQKKYLSEMKELQSTFEEFKVKAYSEFKKLKSQREEEKSKAQYYQNLLIQCQKENELNESNIKETENLFRSKADNIRQLVKANEILKIEVENCKTEIEYLRHQVLTLTDKEKKLQAVALENDYINDKLEELGLNLNSTNLDLSSHNLNLNTSSNNFFNNTYHFNSAKQPNQQNLNRTEIDSKTFASKMNSSPMTNKKEFFNVNKSQTVFNQLMNTMGEKDNNNQKIIQGVGNQNYSNSNTKLRSSNEQYTKNSTNNTSNGFNTQFKKQNQFKNDDNINILENQDIPTLNNRFEEVNYNDGMEDQLLEQNKFSESNIFSQTSGSKQHSNKVFNPYGSDGFQSTILNNKLVTKKPVQLSHINKNLQEKDRQEQFNNNNSYINNYNNNNTENDKFNVQSKLTTKNSGNLESSIHKSSNQTIKGAIGNSNSNQKYFNLVKLNDTPQEQDSNQRRFSNYKG